MIILILIMIMLTIIDIPLTILIMIMRVKRIITKRRKNRERQIVSKELLINGI